MKKVFFILLLLSICFLCSCGISSIDDSGDGSSDCQAKRCEEIGVECGRVSDGCGEILECGECTGGKVCQSYKCSDPGGVCQPKSCRDLNAICGEISDGCGQKLNCGQCEKGKICQANACVQDKEPCVAKTCKTLGAQCGKAPDGCGGMLDCGVCSGGKVCDYQYRCVLSSECVAKSCQELGAQCGIGLNGGCGVSLNCGSCSNGQTCNGQYQCVSGCVPKTCQQLGFNCDSASDGCGGALNCGSCSNGQVCQQNQCKISGCTAKTCQSFGSNYCGSTSDGCGGTLDCKCKVGVCKSNQCQASALSYPKRKNIKGVMPDDMSEGDLIRNSSLGGVSIELKWSDWQPTLESTCGSGHEPYDGYCFTVQSSIVRQIKNYSDAGIVVTAMLYGTPDWAKGSCSAVHVPGYCAPSVSGQTHFARFAGFIAHYFNGESGHGRVSDFVVYKNPNVHAMYNTGCANGTVSNCKVSTWTSHYAETYNQAYDAIKKEQQHAKVFFGVDSSFDKSLDKMQDKQNPLMSTMSFVENVVSKFGSREWHVAAQVFAKGPNHVQISVNDWPNLTFGNIGMLVSWFKQKYPGRANNLSIHIVEGAISSAPIGSSTHNENLHSDVLCQSYTNVLGTPGIDSFNYFHMVDDTTKDYGLSLGLYYNNNKHKLSWLAFVMMSQSTSALDCGFHRLPYTRLTRYYSQTNKTHWSTTRMPPEGDYKKDWKSCSLDRENVSGTVALYECRVGGAQGKLNRISRRIDCGGDFNMGPVGYIFTHSGSGRVSLYSCKGSSGGTDTYYFSDDVKCGGGTMLEELGYAVKCE